MTASPISPRWRLAGALRRLPWEVRGRDRLRSWLLRGQSAPPGEHSGSFGPDLRYRVRYSDDDALLAFFFLQYERPVLAPVLEACLRPGDVFFDVGANIGIYSAWAARLVRDLGEVHAFEPVPSTRPHIERLIRENALNNVIVASTAMGSEVGSLTLWVVPGGSDHASAVLHNDGQPVTVNASTLDNYYAETRCRTPALIKIDVEGCELQVMQGGRKLLGRPDAPAIVFEYHHWGESDQFVEICALLERHDYRLFGLRPAGLQPIEDSRLGAVSANTLALHPERHARILKRLINTRFRRNQFPC